MLLLSPVPPERLLPRFLEVRRWLARFGAEGTSAPAALLCAIDAPPDELLDDLRIAAAAVHAHRLSLGALENLGLGVKLLVQHALAGQLPVARLPVRIVQAVSTFHAATVHPRVLEDEWHHPVHSHRIYG